MQEPAAGNSRIGWTAHWNPKNHLTPMAAPGRWKWRSRASTSTGTSRFADGFSFTALLTRNFKRPWEQNSLSGSGSFSVRETHARFVLSKEAPAVHLLAVADPSAQTFGLQLAAWARQEQTLHWLFESDGGVHKEGTLAVPAGQTAIAAADAGPGQAGPRQFSHQGQSADGGTNLSGLERTAPVGRPEQPDPEDGRHRRPASP